MVMFIEERDLFIMSPTMYDISVENLDMQRLNANTCLKEVYPRPLLTRKDPSPFGYLKKIIPIVNVLNNRKKLQLWYLESGCSWNMIRQRSIFQHMHIMNGGLVAFRGNKKGKIAGVGKIGMLKQSPSRS